MTRPKLKDTERKEKRITVRFCPNELKELSSQAEISGLSVSELVRRKSLGKQIVPITDLKMLSELRRSGGLLKNFFNQTGGLYQQKTYAILTELHAAAIRIGQRREES